MLRLDSLRPPVSKKKPKRLGRGPGSGHGKTATRGHKGQKARKGFEISPAFEGGQMPFIRRIPKRGFINRTSRQYQIVNLNQINEKFEKDVVITAQVLKDSGLVKKITKPIKILGNGELNKPLTIKAHKFSRRAKAKIEKVGAEIELLTPKQ